MISTLSGFVYARRRAVLMVAVSVAIVAGVFGVGVASKLDPFGATDPGTQSVQATNRYTAAAHQRIEPDVIAMVSVGNAFSSAARSRVARVASTLARQPGVRRVDTFYTTHNPALVSRDHRLTYLSVYFRPVSDKQIQDESKLIVSRLQGVSYVQLGGVGVVNAEVNTQVSSDLARAEMFAFPFICLLSLLFFRSLVASILPPLLGGMTILMTFLMLRLVSDATHLSVYALNFVTGLGLGLAIDYSLFIVARYREEAAVHGYGPVAVKRTLATAGRTVMFSSITVAVSIASLAVFPQEFLYSMGIAGAIAVLIAMTLALTVLPALLAALGPRINAGAPKFLARARERETAVMERGFWYRLSHFVMRRPARVAIVAGAVMIALGIPFLGIRFVTATPKVLPTSATARRVDDVMNSRFPAHRADPLDVVIGLPARSPQVAALRGRIARMPDVAAVSPAASAGATNSIVYVIAEQGPTAAPTKQLVRDVRALHPAYYVGVAGTTAGFLDLESSLRSHLPVVLAIVVGATLLILFLMTGSVILPLKAVLMNTLTLSAMVGILVWVFQDGHLSGLLGFTSEGALDATMPVFLAAVGFGLATDYGVFLLGRIKEAHEAGLPNDEAVARGLERTGRIVTAAAMLFAVAIGAFVTSKIIFIKELGLGAALAVLIDASLIRALLVPSLMALLGPANWWAPKPLRRLHNRIGLHEGDRDRVAVEPVASS